MELLILLPFLLLFLFDIIWQALIEAFFFFIGCGQTKPSCHISAAVSSLSLSLAFCLPCTSVPTTSGSAAPSCHCGAEPLHVTNVSKKRLNHRKGTIWHV
jgi:hypothetical protein